MSQNSNLVLQADTRLIERRPRDEATGEVLSLSGKISGSRMGDRYQRTKPQLSKTEEKAKKSKKSKQNESSKYDLSKLKGQSLLSEDIGQVVGILYRPKTPETRQTYEIILSFISDMIGDQPRDVLCGAADEILQVIKSDKMKEKEKRKECELLIGAMPEEKYTVLASLSRKITDFGVDERTPQIQTDDNLDETYGVNVQFEESDEEDDEDIVEEVRDGDEDDEADGEEANFDSAINARNLESTKVETRRDRKSKTTSAIHPREIDAFWLQRNLSKAYDDPVVAQQKAADVLKILKVARDDHEVENQLVSLLGFDQFDFIKVLRQNRATVLYCTLLASAQKQSEKDRLKEKMRSDPDLAKILKALEATDGESERSRKDMGKAYTYLNDEDLDDESTPAVKSKILDLEDIAFTQGSHFMANKRCQLPEGSFRKQRKGCEVIYVPALKQKPFEPNEV